LNGTHGTSCRARTHAAAHPMLPATSPSRPYRRTQRTADPLQCKRGTPPHPPPCRLPAEREPLRLCVWHRAGTAQGRRAEHRVAQMRRPMAFEHTRRIAQARPLDAPPHCSAPKGRQGRAGCVAVATHHLRDELVEQARREREQRRVGDAKPQLQLLRPRRLESSRGNKRREGAHCEA
jgi:hypothetical protein